MNYSLLYIILVYSLFFIFSIFLSVLINGLMLKFVKTLGIRDKDSMEIRWSAKSKPAIGGISFFIMFLISASFYSIFFQQTYNSLNIQFIGIVISTTFAFLMGLFDDAYNTRPIIKFSTQILCSLILIFTGTYIHIFDNQIWNYLITLFWVVGMMNSLNMLDNMDAITSIVSISIIVTIILNILYVGNLTCQNMIILLGVLAALLGFLYYNWHPSKIYMGDTGSQFLGAFLSIMGIIYFWNSVDSSGNEVHTKQFILSVLVFAIPIIDTTTVFIKRLYKGKSPFIGGRDHTTHHLSYYGLSDKQVAYVFIIISISIMALVFIGMNFIQNWNYIYLSLYSFYFIFLFLILFIIANNIKKED